MSYNKFLKEKSAEFVEDIPEDLKCVYCRGILIDPYITPCGHSYCHDCLVTYLNDGDEKFCMVNESICNMEILKININTTKFFVSSTKIKLLNIKCKNYNCNVIIKLMDLEKHLKNCDKRLFKCPYKSLGCDIEDMDKLKLKKHVDENCIEHATIICEMNGDLKNEICELKREINKRQYDVRIIYLYQCLTPLLNKIFFRVADLGLRLKFQNQIENLKIELEGKQNQISHLQNEVESLSQQVDELKTELRQQKDDFQTHYDKLKLNIKNQNTSKKFKSEDYLRLKNELKNELRQHKADFQTQYDQLKLNLENQLAAQKSKSEEDNLRLKNKFQIMLKAKFELEYKILQNKLDSFLYTMSSYDWIVENYSNKYEEARRNNDVYFESPQFFLKGYCIVLMLYPCRKIDGDDRASVKFKLIKNNFDDHVKWPCETKFKFSIINRYDNSDFTAAHNYKHKNIATNGGENVWERPGDVPRVSPRYYPLCRCDTIKINPNFLLKNDLILIRSCVSE